MDYFTYFVDETLVDMIVEETNRYRQQNITQNWAKTGKWVDTNTKEMYLFIATSLLMAINTKPKLKQYWSTDEVLNTPIYSQLFSRNRYLSLLRNLHFTNNEDNNENRLRKVDKVIENLKEKFAQAFIPFQNLCIDESLLLWKGKLSFKQYIPSKRNRFGIKLFLLCDCETKYVLDFIVYIGSATEITNTPELGISGSIVQTLMKDYLQKGRVLYVDNWYTSIPLFTYLYENNTGACGTIRKNRKGLPNLSSKIPKGERIYLHNNFLLAMKYHDKREVFMLSSVHSPEMQETGKYDRNTNREIHKPKCIIDYNSNMGAVDQVDMQITFSECQRKTLKWYKKLFFHLLDLAIYNAYVLYRMRNPVNIQFCDFKVLIIKEIINTCCTKRPISSKK